MNKRILALFHKRQEDYTEETGKADDQFPTQEHTPFLCIVWRLTLEKADRNSKNQKIIVNIEKIGFHTEMETRLLKFFM